VSESSIPPLCSTSSPTIGAVCTCSVCSALQSLFERAGLEQIDTRTIDVTSSFARFQRTLGAQTPSFNR